MKKSEAIYEVIRKAARPITPQEIRDIIKVEYPQFYGTESDKLAVEKKGIYIFNFLNPNGLCFLPRGNRNRLRSES